MSQDSREDLVPSILEGIQDSRWRTQNPVKTQVPGSYEYPGPMTLTGEPRPRTWEYPWSKNQERLFLEKYLNETILKSNHSKLSFNLNIN